VIPLAFYLAALVLALIEEARTQGRDITAWTVALLCVGLLWGRLG